MGTRAKKERREYKKKMDRLAEMPHPDDPLDESFESVMARMIKHPENFEVHFGGVGFDDDDEEPDGFEFDPFDDED